MQIFVNGEVRAIQSTTVDKVLQALGFDIDNVVISLNNEFLPKHRWDHYRLQDDDHIDVFSPIEGG